MHAALAGFITGLSLIVAIGAQNAYLLRLGLMRAYVGISVAICSISDAVLILIGVAGIGAIVQAHTNLLHVVAWIGAVYLSYFAISAARRAFKTEVLIPTQENKPSRKTVVLSILGFTFLNPHVYLDTVLLVGSIGSQFGSQRWWFALGASSASLVWFTSLGYGSKALAKAMSRPLTWRVLDILIAIVMATIAVSLMRTALR